MKIKRFSKTLLRIVISLVLIAYIVKTQDFSAIIAKIYTFNFLIFLSSILLLLCGTLVSSLRWQEILKTSNKNVNLFSLFSLYLKGYFYNNFLPTQMGGDFYKALSLSSSIGDKSISFFSVFVDRFAGLVVLLILAVYGVAIKVGGFYSIILVLLTFVGLALYLPLLKVASKKIKFLQKFYDASILLVKNKKSGFKIFIYSILVQVFSFSMSYVLFMGFNIYLDIKDVLAFMPLVSLSLLLPSFNGWGAQELVYKNLFSASGVLASTSIAVSLLIQAIRIIMSLIGGIFILLNLGRIKKDSHESS